jgi:hypothetical protein
MPNPKSEISSARALTAGSCSPKTYRATNNGAALTATPMPLMTR